MSEPNVNVRREWQVEGPRGALWFEARDGDEACSMYVGRYRLTPWEHDALVVVNVRQIDAGASS